MRLFYFSAFLMMGAATANTAVAEVVPERLRGVYGEANPEGICKEFTGPIFLSAFSATLFSKDPADFSRNYIQIAPVEWDGESVTIQTGGIRNVISAEMLEGMSCRMPAHLSAVFSETMAVLLSSTDAYQACTSSDTELCFSNVVRVLDVSNDDRLSVAEISRGVRTAAFLLAYEAAVSKPDPRGGAVSSVRAGRVEQEKIFGPVLLSGMAAPIISANLIASYDYDGDGFLQLNELLQDRNDLQFDDLVASMSVRLSERALSSVFENLPSIFSRMLSFR